METIYSTQRVIGTIIEGFEPTNVVKCAVLKRYLCRPLRVASDARHAEPTTSGTVATLSARLKMSDRLQRRLVEFMVLVASQHITNADLAPVIQ